MFSFWVYAVLRQEANTELLGLRLHNRWSPRSPGRYLGKFSSLCYGWSMLIPGVHQMNFSGGEIAKLLYPLTTTCSLDFLLQWQYFYGPGQDPSADSCFLPPTTGKPDRSVSTDMNRILKYFSFVIIFVAALEKTKQATFRDCSIYVYHLAKLNSH